MPERAAIVTGASAGIGLAVASALAARGYGVTLVGRDAGRLDAAARGLAGDGSEVATVVADMTEPGAAAHVVAAHDDRFGTTDVVVANVGLGRAGAAAATAPADLDAMVATNVSALFALAGAAVPALRPTAPRAGSGWFVVTSSLSGVWPTAGFAGYSATKAAGLSLARSITAEEDEAGVRSCAICPAFVRTDMSAWAQRRVPADAMLDPGDVAAAVGFLLELSPAAVVTELVLRRRGASPVEP